VMHSEVGSGHFASPVGVWMLTNPGPLMACFCSLSYSHTSCSRFVPIRRHSIEVLLQLSSGAVIASMHYLVPADDSGQLFSAIHINIGDRGRCGHMHSTCDPLLSVALLLDYSPVTQLISMAQFSCMIHGSSSHGMAGLGVAEICCGAAQVLGMVLALLHVRSLLGRLVASMPPEGARSLALGCLHGRGTPAGPFVHIQDLYREDYAAFMHRPSQGSAILLVHPL
jgi:hypothetical protein